MTKIEVRIYTDLLTNHMFFQQACDIGNDV